RPVVGNAIERTHPEIGWVHARKMRGVEDRATANSVEVGDLHPRAAVGARIVRLSPAPARADVEITVTPPLPAATGAWDVGVLHPIALLEAKDAHLRFRQAPGDCCARGAGADDQYIYNFVLRHFRSSLR